MTPGRQEVEQNAVRTFAEIKAKNILSWKCITGRCRQQNPGKCYSSLAKLHHPKVLCPDVNSLVLEKYLQARARPVEGQQHG